MLVGRRNYKGNNACERSFSKSARRLGYFVLKNGWPDFFCFGENGRCVFVEIKSNNDKLRYEQYIVLAILHDMGLDVRISNGEGMGRNLNKQELKMGHDLLFSELKTNARVVKINMNLNKNHWLKARIDCEAAKKVLEYI